MVKKTKNSKTRNNKIIQICATKGYVLNKDIESTEVRTFKSHLRVHSITSKACPSKGFAISSHKDSNHSKGKLRFKPCGEYDDSIPKKKM